jgi:hypothetical protein
VRMGSCDLQGGEALHHAGRRMAKPGIPVMPTHCNRDASTRRLWRFIHIFAFAEAIGISADCSPCRLVLKIGIMVLTWVDSYQVGGRKCIPWLIGSVRLTFAERCNSLIPVPTSIRSCLARKMLPSSTLEIPVSHDGFPLESGAATRGSERPAKSHRYLGKEPVLNSAVRQQGHTGSSDDVSRFQTEG